jgi:hypothetical protein
VDTLIKSKMKTEKAKIHAKVDCMLYKTQHGIIFNSAFYACRKLKCPTVLGKIFSGIVDIFLLGINALRADSHNKMSQKCPISVAGDTVVSRTVFPDFGYSNKRADDLF